MHLITRKRNVHLRARRAFITLQTLAITCRVSFRPAMPLPRVKSRPANSIMRRHPYGCLLLSLNREPDRILRSSCRRGHDVKRGRAFSQNGDVFGRPTSVGIDHCVCPVHGYRTPGIGNSSADREEGHVKIARQSAYFQGDIAPGDRQGGGSGQARCILRRDHDFVRACYQRQIIEPERPVTLNDAFDLVRAAFLVHPPCQHVGCLIIDRPPDVIGVACQFDPCRRPEDVQRRRVRDARIVQDKLKVRACRVPCPVSHLEAYLVQPVG